tara:strand:- start:276 stop:734 length:459 start_codon:yes stop_codon:yes gene_type:complete
MAKIIKFPTPEERRQKEIDEAYDKAFGESKAAVDYYSQQCVEATQNMLEIIEDSVLEGMMHDWDVFLGMQFRNQKDFIESRDFYVIMNLWNAMLNRFVGLPHELHKDLDVLLVKVKAIEEMNRAYTESQENDIEFQPEFEFEIDPEEPDDNN